MAIENLILIIRIYMILSRAVDKLGCSNYNFSLSAVIILTYILFTIPRLEDSITIKAVSNTISYQQALMNCKADGKEICTSKEICKDGKTPEGGPLPGDKWVPVKDSYNEWLQIGMKK